MSEELVVNKFFIWLHTKPWESRLMKLAMPLVFIMSRAGMIGITM